MLTSVSTGKAPAAIGPYSQAITDGETIWVAGQLGMDPATTELVSEKLEDQARQALANMQAILEAGGFSLEQVVAVDVFLTSMDDFAAFNKVYESFFITHRPARAVIAVAGLPKGGKVEIKCIASGK